jgi:hypothetical protein
MLLDFERTLASVTPRAHSAAESSSEVSRTPSGAQLVSLMASLGAKGGERGSLTTLHRGLHSPAVDDAQESREDALLELLRAVRTGSGLAAVPPIGPSSSPVEGTRPSKTPVRAPPAVPEARADVSVTPRPLVSLAEARLLGVGSAFGGEGGRTHAFVSGMGPAAPREEKRPAPARGPPAAPPSPPEHQSGLDPLGVAADLGEVMPRSPSPPARRGSPSGRRPLGYIPPSSRAGVPAHLRSGRRSESPTTSVGVAELVRATSVRWREGREGEAPPSLRAPSPTRVTVAHVPQRAAREEGASTASLLYAREDDEVGSEGEGVGEGLGEGGALPASYTPARVRALWSTVPLPLPASAEYSAWSSLPPLAEQAVHLGWLPLETGPAGEPPFSSLDAAAAAAQAGRAGLAAWLNQLGRASAAIRSDLREVLARLVPAAAEGEPNTLAIESGGLGKDALKARVDAARAGVAELAGRGAAAAVGTDEVVSALRLWQEEIAAAARARLHRLTARLDARRRGLKMLQPTLVARIAAKRGHLAALNEGLDAAAGPRSAVAAIAAKLDAQQAAIAREEMAVAEGEAVVASTGYSEVLTAAIALAEQAEVEGVRATYASALRNLQADSDARLAAVNAQGDERLTALASGVEASQAAQFDASRAVLTSRASSSRAIAEELQERLEGVEAELAGEADLRSLKASCRRMWASLSADALAAALGVDEEAVSALRAAGRLAKSGAAGSGAAPAAVRLPTARPSPLVSLGLYRGSVEPIPIHKQGPLAVIRPLTLADAPAADGAPSKAKDAKRVKPPVDGPKRELPIHLRLIGLGEVAAVVAAAAADGKPLAGGRPSLRRPRRDLPRQPSSAIVASALADIRYAPTASRAGASRSPPRGGAPPKPVQAPAPVPGADADTPESRAERLRLRLVASYSPAIRSRTALSAWLGDALRLTAYSDRMTTLFAIAAKVGTRTLALLRAGRPVPHALSLSVILGQLKEERASADATAVLLHGPGSSGAGIAGYSSPGARAQALADAASAARHGAAAPAMGSPGRLPVPSGRLPLPPAWDLSVLSASPPPSRSPEDKRLANSASASAQRLLAREAIDVEGEASARAYEGGEEEELELTEGERAEAARISAALVRAAASVGMGSTLRTTLRVETLRAGLVGQGEV